MLISKTSLSYITLVLMNALLELTVNASQAFYASSWYLLGDYTLTNNLSTRTCGNENSGIKDQLNSTLFNTDESSPSSFTGWFLESDSDQDFNCPNASDTRQFVDLEQIKKLTGIEYYKLPVENLDKNPLFMSITKGRGYAYEDEIEVSRKAIPDFDKRMKIFSTEHIHTGEEMRFYLAGSGFFDFRDKYNRWIRVTVTTGDLFVLPAGILHRFIMDKKEFLIARRFFITETEWVAIYRPDADNHPSRLLYEQQMGIERHDDLNKSSDDEH